jgi:hypothetical protein
MEVAQLLLSLMHAWGLDPDLDKVCEGKLGLLRPMIPVSFGIMSKGGKIFVISDYFSYMRILVFCCTALGNKVTQLFVYPPILCKTN